MDQADVVALVAFAKQVQDDIREGVGVVLDNERPDSTLDPDQTQLMLQVQQLTRSPLIEGDVQALVVAIQDPANAAELDSHGLYGEMLALKLEVAEWAKRRLASLIARTAPARRIRKAADEAFKAINVVLKSLVAALSVGRALLELKDIVHPLLGIVDDGDDGVDPSPQQPSTPDQSMPPFSAPDLSKPGEPHPLAWHLFRARNRG